jgi:hypothetical protein
MLGFRVRLREGAQPPRNDSVGRTEAAEPLKCEPGDCLVCQWGWVSPS